tara:strand:+ start:6034 stop:6513 length:480 start_codon:yes stop_codon:yes gene_type:complete
LFILAIFYLSLGNNSGYNVLCLLLGIHIASNLAVVILVLDLVLEPQSLFEASLLNASSFLSLFVFVLLLYTMIFSISLFTKAGVNFLSQAISLNSDKNNSFLSSSNFSRALSNIHCASVALFSSLISCLICFLKSSVFKVQSSSLSLLSSHLIIETNSS